MNLRQDKSVTCATGIFLRLKNEKYFSGINKNVLFLTKLVMETCIHTINPSGASFRTLFQRIHADLGRLYSDFKNYSDIKGSQSRYNSPTSFDYSFDMRYLQTFYATCGFSDRSVCPPTQDGD